MKMETKTRFFKSPIGQLKIESQEEYICAISIVKEEIHNSENHDDAVLLECCTQLQAYFDGNLSVFTFPMQQEGTDFQQAVWKALCEIPFGKHISYAELSNNINNPEAVRAVGLANGKNKIAIAIPCHRVIGKNGMLTGYAGGLEAKRWLLEHELHLLRNPLTLF